MELIEYHWFVHVVIDRTEVELGKIYGQKVFASNTAAMIRTGDIVVVLIINVVDPFNINFGTRDEHCWVTTPDELNDRFIKIDNPNNNDFFYEVKPK